MRAMSLVLPRYDDGDDDAPAQADLPDSTDLMLSDGVMAMQASCTTP